MVYSSEVGVEKPDRRIFQQRARPAGGGGGPEAVLHVGDGRLEDVEGALAAGMYAVQVSRGRGRGLASLAALPALLEETHARPQAGREPAERLADHGVPGVLDCP